MKNKLFEVIAIIAIVIVFAGVTAEFVNEYKSCSARGGAFIRAPFWYECIKR